MKCLKCGNEIEPSVRDGKGVIILPKVVQISVRCECGEVNLVEFINPQVVNSYHDE
jgi:hypothetical protein